MKKRLLLALPILVVTVAGQELVGLPSRDCRALEIHDIPDGDVTSFTQGQTVHVEMEITNDDPGVYEFYFCPQESPQEEEECLNRVPLDSGEIITAGKIESDFQLPEDVTCEHCVLQWVMKQTGCSEDLDLCLDEETVKCSDITITANKSRKKRGAVLAAAIGGLAGAAGTGSIGAIQRRVEQNRREGKSFRDRVNERRAQGRGLIGGTERWIQSRRNSGRGLIGWAHMRRQG